MIYLVSPYSKLRIENSAGKFMATLKCVPHYNLIHQNYFRPIEIPIGQSLLCFCALECNQIITLHLVETHLLDYFVSECEEDTILLQIARRDKTFIDDEVVFDMDATISDTVTNTNISLPPTNKTLDKIDVSFPTINTIGFISTSGTCWCDMKSELQAVVDILEEKCLLKTSMCQDQIYGFKQACFSLLFDRYNVVWKPDSPIAGSMKVLSISKLWDIFPMNLDIIIRKAIGICGMTHIDIVKAFDSELTIHFNPGTVKYYHNNQEIVKYSKDE